jgi:hypothetical protein
MELPRFFSNETNDQSPPGQRSAPAELSAEELAELNHMLDEQSGRRRRSSPTAVIRIMVDGIERARLNPAEQSSISFSAEEDAETIEVKTTDAYGDLLLATHLLTSIGKDPHDAAIVFSIRLEGGQDLSLSITRRRIEANGEADLLVRFGYRETNPLRAARLWWQRLSLRLSRKQGPRILRGGARIPARLIVVVSVVVICLMSYLAYERLRSRQTSGPAQTASIQPTPVVQEPSSSPSAVPELDQSASQPVRRAKSERAPAVKLPSASGADAARDEDVEVDAMRSGSVVPNLTLREVKKIYIEIRGDATFNELRSNLIESLRSSGVVTVATDADEADAALKIVVSQTSTSARLVNARGVVLWSKAYSREATKDVSEIVKDLLSNIR